ncbi:hydrogenase nickel insertion protein HypA [Campylobacter blaseri]|uniref:Hydrogenase maturation factor HypA n=1 Tax=Campylobacter blaseri TaxID=2042961 RepID=A0A2P8QYT2_9BACT|nr:hydrogenase maturation nickel metallochaperone HypA [Campylobacter blaseri]PSM51408.1 hydrogenase maturation nickel metallochaperone HypA [Campylobacter blaseri]PSM52858.1 hydrogenase maturation nickel metallochaperone HypA [Campylobacter blaseri]QKF86161.1 hydrogenase nickel insertion protein HypA [Campylobacter blaseri]
MHELSIIIDLVALCEKNAKEQNAKEIESLEIKIGRLSGVEPHYLESAYEFYKKGTICENAKLIIHVQNIVVQCNNCGEKNELDKNEFLCPKCGSNKLDVIDGEDMYLMRLTMK